MDKLASYLILITPALAIIYAQAHVGIFLLCIIILCALSHSVLCKMSHEQKKVIPILFILLCVSLSVVFYGSLQEWVDTSGRDHFWAAILEAFWGDEAVNKWVGFGQGSTVAWGTVIAKKADLNYRGNMLWIHNDFLQLLWEQGMLGLISYMVLFFYVFKKAFLSLEKFTCVLCLSFAALANFPFHWAVQCFLSAFIIIYTLRDPPDAQ